MANESEILPGALVECTDWPLGTVEEVLRDEGTGAFTGLLVRHGQADYLLRVPACHITASSAWRVELDQDFCEAEASAIEWGQVPPSVEHIADGGPTDPSPYAEELIGRMPTWQLGGPSTG